MNRRQASRISRWNSLRSFGGALLAWSLVPCGSGLLYGENRIPIADRADISTERLVETAAYLAMAKNAVERVPMGDISAIKKALQTSDRKSLVEGIRANVARLRTSISFDKKDRITTAVAFGHIKNACLRIQYDRIERQIDHENWVNRGDLKVVRRQTLDYLAGIEAAVK